MHDFIQILNHTSGSRVVFYCLVLLCGLAIIVTFLKDVIKAILKLISKRRKLPQRIYYGVEFLDEDLESYWHHTRMYSSRKVAELAAKRKMSGSTKYADYEVFKVYRKE